MDQQQKNDLSWYALLELMHREKTVDYDFRDKLSDEGEADDEFACDRERITSAEIQKRMDGNSGQSIFFRG